jgi:DNA repair photolyase
MTINESKGNMYPDVKTWNGMYGMCQFMCVYCYNKIHWKKWGNMRLNEKALKDNLGENNFYFVGSSCDMFAEAIPDWWITSVLTHCLAYPHNTYLMQTKNPKRMYGFYRHSWMGNNYIYGTTIESNRQYPEFSKAPSVDERKKWITLFSGKKMLSVEPIMDFDLESFVEMIKDIRAEYVSIGANSLKYITLPEPPKEKVIALITELRKFTEVRIKPNLNRLMK